MTPTLKDLLETILIKARFNEQLPEDVDAALAALRAEPDVQPQVPQAWVWRYADGDYHDQPFATLEECNQEALAYEGRAYPLYLAAPQSAVPEWQPIETAPPEDTPVWLFEAGRIWVGTHIYDSEGGCYTNCYGTQYWTSDKWECTDAEIDDDYKPTHWMSLPQPPKGEAL